MRFMKKVVAFTMAVMLLIPSVAVNAEEPQVLGVQAAEQLGQEPTAADTNTGTDEKKDNETPAVGDTADENAVQPEEKQGNASEEGKDAPEAEAQEEEKLPEEEQVQKEEEALPKNGASEEGKPQDIENVQFNTGDYVWTIVNEDDFNTYEYGDGYFEEDGSYTINIPELNPFFPYEVQFTSNGKTENKWFQSPDDTVEVGGHIFKVAANFDGTGITQMSMEVAGDTVVVYPEEKTFTNDGDGVQEMSLIPLEKRNLRVDLQGYTPLELTMVKLKTIINESGVDISDDKKVAWSYAGLSGDKSRDYYVVSGVDDEIDLSYGLSTATREYTSWELVVGDGDQLNSNNIRYALSLKVTDPQEWLKPTVCYEDAQKNRTNADITYNYYKDSSGEYIENGKWDEKRYLDTDATGYSENTYVSFALNKVPFSKTQISSIKVLDGTYKTKNSVLQAAKTKDITSQIMCPDMKKASSGLMLSQERSLNLDLTIVGYDAVGNIKGILPFQWKIDLKGTQLKVRLYEKNVQDSALNYSNISKGYSRAYFLLEKEHSLDDEYTLTIDENSEKKITAVFLGKYSSIKEAVAAGAKNIRNQVVGNKKDITGYTGCFNVETYFTVFVGEDTDLAQERYCFYPYLDHRSDNSYLSNDNTISFKGLLDADGNSVSAYCIRGIDDSYSLNNYFTILVGEDTDLSKEYAPVFKLGNAKATVYATGGTSKEESGKTLHSFAKNDLQYTVYAENGEAANYWLQVKKADTSYGQLYINSLIDQNANTHVENGVVYSTREVMLDKYYDYVHNICLVNVGKEDIPELSVDLSSDVVELDDYWNLTGKQPLSGMSTVKTPSWNSGKEGELPNLAKLRLRAKEGVKDGTDVSGTLTIKSGNKVLMVLTLTGVVGDPCITTESIPDAVKYVPYGTAIQNSNKYKWITVKYYQESGNLPAGMEIKENGELYGTPQETGTFHFTVRAVFTAHGRSFYFDAKTADFTLTVKDNTNDNVYNESDIADGYILETSIGNETSAGSHDFYLPEITDSLFVSKGIYPNFVDLWLNGEKLVRGVDYDAASGSTRITISAQTLQNKALKTGVNTIAAEFRDGGAANFAKDNDPKNALKRTAQNFRLDKTDADGGNGGGGHSHGSSDDGDDAGNGAGKGVTISGYLVDGSGNPISGMTVELHSTPRTTVTAQNGFFRFTNVEFGQHELFAKDSSDNILASKKFELRSGKTVGFAGNVLSAPAGSAVVMTVKVANGNMTFFNVRRGNPQTGDHANTAMWMLLMAGSCAVLAGLAVYRKRRSAR